MGVAARLGDTGAVAGSGDRCAPPTVTATTVTLIASSAIAIAAATMGKRRPALASKAIPQMLQRPPHKPYTGHRRSFSNVLAAVPVVGCSRTWLGLGCVGPRAR